MPNWCENNLQIDGPPDDMRKFLDKVQDPTVGQDYQIAKTLYLCLKIVKASENGVITTGELIGAIVTLCCGKMVY